MTLNNPNLDRFLFISHSMKRFDPRIMIMKVVKSVLIFSIPVIGQELIMRYPEIAQMSILDVIKLFIPTLSALTVGGAITGITNYIKVRWGARIP